MRPLFCSFGQQPAITAVVVVTEEDRLPVVAALDHVQRLVRQKIPPEPRHRSTRLMGIRTILSRLANYGHYDPISYRDPISDRAFVVWH